MIEKGWPPRREKPRRSGRNRALIGTGLCAGGLLLLKWLLDKGVVSDDTGLALVILTTVVATFLLAGPAKHPSSDRPRSDAKRQH